MTWTLAMVNAFYHPYVGGSEKHMYELSRRLARKHNVVVITSRLENTPEYEEIDGVKVHRLDAQLLKLPHIYPPPYPICKDVYRAIEQLHKKYGFDFINIHGRWFRSFNKAIYFGKKNDIKTVLTLHNGKPTGIDPLTSFLGLTYDNISGKRLLRSVDRIISVSEAVREEMGAYGIDKSKITPIHNGVDTAVFRRTKPKFRDEYPQFERIVLYLGRMIEQKGLPYLLEAAERIHQKEPEVGFLMVGKGKKKEQLMEMVRKRGMENYVIFPGFVDESDLPALYSSADLYVLPSLWEVLPISLLEALSVGLPLISTDAGGNAEIVKDGVNGYVVQKRDSAALEERIIRLLSDDKRREKMSRTSRKIAIKEFDWDIIANKTEKFYNAWYENSEKE